MQCSCICKTAFAAPGGFFKFVSSFYLRNNRLTISGFRQAYRSC